MDPLCQHEFPVVHSIRTHVMKYGASMKGKPLALIIPGNPGCIEFYDEFMKMVHQKTGLPVWGLSHAGHSIVPSEMEWRKPDQDVFTLEGQIQHKVCFINEFIPEDVELVLIGHSIGAYVVLQIMDRVDSHKIKEGVLLFPTIERMSISPQGTRMTPLLKNWRWLFYLVAHTLNLLPEQWRTGLLNYVFEKRKKNLGPVADCIQKAAINVINPYCLANAMYMAHVEMGKVDELNADQVCRHLPKLRFYYGGSDHWCPPEYYYDMVKRFPDHQKIEICKDGHRHAFIIDASEPMAEKVGDWLQHLD